MKIIPVKLRNFDVHLSKGKRNRIYNCNAMDAEDAKVTALDSCCNFGWVVDNVSIKQ